MKAMFVTPKSTIPQSWFKARTDFAVGPTLKYEFDEAKRSGSPRLAYLVNYEKPLRDVMSLLYTMSELLGYVKSIRIKQTNGAAAMASGQMQENIVKWLTETLQNPAAWNGLKTVRFNRESKYIKVIKTRMSWFTECTPPDYTVQKLLLEEISAELWDNDEAYRRMTEVDENGELTYKANPDDPQYLGYGIVCMGTNMWDPTGVNSCVCCKGRSAPIFLGLEAMKECVGVAYPEASSNEAISRLHMALCPLMQHTTIGNYIQPAVADATRPVPHVHELGVYTRLYTSPGLRHRFQHLVDVAQFQEYVATWAWFLWNFRALKGDHQKFFDRMTTEWGLYRAMGKREWRQFRLPPTDADQEDTYVRDIQGVCGDEMAVGKSVFTILQEANLVPEST